MVNVELCQTQIAAYFNIWPAMFGYMLRFTDILKSVNLAINALSL